MNKKFWVIFIALAFIEVVVVATLLLRGLNFQLLSPQGIIAYHQRNLILLMIGIMLIVAIPLLSSLYFFAFRYRSSRRKERDRVGRKQGGSVEIVWWVIPTIFVAILAGITWSKTHALDPYKPLETYMEPVRIQVVALNWKWLFLYPQYGIATVNYIQIPINTPINFELTADAPMNSFWIPQLSGQIYSMTGMVTKLHLEANKEGTYQGQAAEINGRGYSGMTFKVKATSVSEFDEWVSIAKNGKNTLRLEEYEKLSLPSENVPAMLYSSYDKSLYEKIISKFMSRNGGIMEEDNHE